MNYKPYSKPNYDLLGTKIKSKDTSDLYIIIGIENEHYLIDRSYYNSNELFNIFTTLDNKPLGEVIEESIILDKPYLVRNTNINKWLIRYGYETISGVNYFINYGATSLSIDNSNKISTYKQFIEYNEQTKHLLNTTDTI